MNGEEGEGNVLGASSLTKIFLNWGVNIADYKPTQPPLSTTSVS